ncbi:centrosomal protein of 19 kDa [Gadus macrocephalus]|uniref:centrosomal protein of 19 kDa n=1 Tax=Gadus macrocephalus TaxID=80720 RepID=UPI0028CB437C|nr:centrosomal protein of 19 kDa [Gadus macrocephalus]
MSYEAKRCGVQFSPPAIILLYKQKDTNQVRKRIIPVRNFSKYSDCCLAAERLKNHFRHKEYLGGVPLSQLKRLHTVLRDHMQGHSLQHSHASFQVDPEEDLNKLNDDDLARKKGQMDQLFEQNRRLKDDPDFVYDIEVEFSQSDQEKCSWDAESDDGF